jgi:ketosteroid isomerase-like protein
MTSDETAVAAANLAFYRALEARNLSAMDQVWLHDESVTCVHPGWHRLNGWEEVRRSWENIFANARRWTVACDDIRIHVAEDAAWVTCTELLTLAGADADDEPARMQATNIFARHGGVWRLLHHHASAFATESPEEEEPVN